MILTQLSEKASFSFSYFSYVRKQYQLFNTRTFPLQVRTNENKNGARRPDVGFMDAIQYQWFLDCIKSARRAYINFKLQHPQRNKFIWFISSSSTCMIYGDEMPVLILKLARLCRTRFHKSGKDQIVWKSSGTFVERTR